MRASGRAFGLLQLVDELILPPLCKLQAAAQFLLLGDAGIHLGLQGLELRDEGRDIWILLDRGQVWAWDSGGFGGWGDAVLVFSEPSPADSPQVHRVQGCPVVLPDGLLSQETLDQ